MTVLAPGPAYDAYMERWMREHPADWYRCRTCLNWRIGGSPETDPTKEERCAQCPPKKKAPKPPDRKWARRGAGYDDASFAPGPYA